jgi:hypothetical protein
MCLHVCFLVLYTPQTKKPLQILNLHQHTYMQFKRTEDAIGRLITAIKQHCFYVSHPKWHFTTMHFFFCFRFVALSAPTATTHFQLFVRGIYRIMALVTDFHQTQNTAYYREALHVPPSDETIAIAALSWLGGQDIVVASLLMSLSEHGWGLWEEELRHLNDALHCNGTLPSLMVSSLRGGMRSEIVAVRYGMTPRHGELLGVGLNTFSRIKRLVLVENSFGCQGAAGIAYGLTIPGNGVTELLLDKCGIGDFGAAALAGALISPNCKIVIMQLEENEIRDDGALAFAKQIKVRPTGAQVLLGGNYISEVAAAQLIEAYMEAPRGAVKLASRFFPQQRSPPYRSGGGVDSTSTAETLGVVWRSYSTPQQRVERPVPAPRAKKASARRLVGLN